MPTSHDLSRMKNSKKYKLCLDSISPEDLFEELSGYLTAEVFSNPKCETRHAHLGVIGGQAFQSYEDLNLSTWEQLRLKKREVARRI